MPQKQKNQQKRLGKPPYMGDRTWSLDKNWQGGDKWQLSGNELAQDKTRQRPIEFTPL